MEKECHLEFPEVWKPQTTLVWTFTAQPMHKVCGDAEHLCCTPVLCTCTQLDVAAVC